jgi:hypothetical protein
LVTTADRAVKQKARRYKNATGVSFSKCLKYP